MYQKWLSRCPRSNKVLDNGSEFNKDFVPLWKDLSIKPKCNTTKNPMSNSPVERINQVLWHMFLPKTSKNKSLSTYRSVWIYPCICCLGSMYIIHHHHQSPTCSISLWVWYDVSYHIYWEIERYIHSQTTTYRQCQSLRESLKSWLLLQTRPTSLHHQRWYPSQIGYSLVGTVSYFWYIYKWYSLYQKGFNQRTDQHSLSWIPFWMTWQNLGGGC